MQKINKTVRIIACVMIAILMVGAFRMSVYAQEKSCSPSGMYYSFSEKDSYQIDNNSTGTEMINSIGTFSVSGDIEDKGNNIFYVQSGNMNISYKANLNNLEKDAKKWHLTEDKSKTVNEIKLDSNILKGAIIVQSSLDGKEWITDKVILDAFSDEETIPNTLFTTKDIQQLNGCYYRVIVAYKLEKQIDSSSILFLEKENYEYMKAAEVYSFFVIDQHTIDTGTVSPEGKPRKEFSTVVNIGKDNGYDLSMAKDMDKDDPHFHRSIGYFTVNGYTRETSDKDGTPVFLKTVGDEVILWFSLTEDINKLFGNKDLCISEDKNGYDKAMVGGDQTNFKHGALLVKYTDEEGHSRDAVTYLDFLKANTMNGADTRIQLYEEGDYEVALDYEVCDSSSLLDSYKNYKIYFKFSIRNGNTMAFPRDSKTGSELKDGAWTADGFTIDLAESKYLTIDFIRKEVVQNADGTISTSVRDNKVGKEGSVYSKKGIYEITVKNQYSDGKPTTVTIYVGNDKNILALAQNRMTVERLNELIREGYSVGDDGALVEPQTAIEPEIETTASEVETIETTVKDEEKPAEITEISSEESTTDNDNSSDIPSATIANEEYDQKSISVIPIALVGVAVAIGAFCRHKKKKVGKEEQ